MGAAEIKLSARADEDWDVSPPGSSFHEEQRPSALYPQIYWADNGIGGIASLETTEDDGGDDMTADELLAVIGEKDAIIRSLECTLKAERAVVLRVEDARAQHQLELEQRAEERKNVVSQYSQEIATLTQLVENSREGHEMTRYRLRLVEADLAIAKKSATLQAPRKEASVQTDPPAPVPGGDADIQTGPPIAAPGVDACIQTAPLGLSPDSAAGVQPLPLQPTPDVVELLGLAGGEGGFSTCLAASPSPGSEVWVPAVLGATALERGADAPEAGGTGRDLASFLSFGIAELDSEGSDCSSRLGPGLQGSTWLGVAQQQPETGRAPLGDPDAAQHARGALLPADWAQAGVTCLSTAQVPLGSAAPPTAPLQSAPVDWVQAGVTGLSTVPAGDTPGLLRSISICTATPPAAHQLPGTTGAPTRNDAAARQLGDAAGALASRVSRDGAENSQPMWHAGTQPEGTRMVRADSVMTTASVATIDPFMVGDLAEAGGELEVGNNFAYENGLDVLLCGYSSCGSSPTAANQAAWLERGLACAARRGGPGSAAAPQAGGGHSVSGARPDRQEQHDAEQLRAMRLFHNGRDGGEGVQRRGPAAGDGAPRPDARAGVARGFGFECGSIPGERSCQAGAFRGGTGLPISPGSEASPASARQESGQQAAAGRSGRGERRWPAPRAGSTDDSRSSSPSAEVLGTWRGMGAAGWALGDPLRHAGRSVSPGSWACEAQRSPRRKQLADAAGAVRGAAVSPRRPPAPGAGMQLRGVGNNGTGSAGDELDGDLHASVRTVLPDRGIMLIAPRHRSTSSSQERRGGGKATDMGAHRSPRGAASDGSPSSLTTNTEDRSPRLRNGLCAKRPSVARTASDPSLLRVSDLKSAGIMRLPERPGVGSVAQLGPRTTRSSRLALATRRKESTPRKVHFSEQRSASPPQHRALSVPGSAATPAVRHLRMAPAMQPSVAHRPLMVVQSGAVMGAAAQCQRVPVLSSVMRLFSGPRGVR